MTKARHPLAAILDDIAATIDAMRATCAHDDGRPAIEAAAYRLAMTRPDGLKGTSYDGIGGHGTMDGSPPPPGVDLNRTVIGDYVGKADLHALFRALDQAAVIVARWQPHAAPSIAQRMSVERKNEPACQSCARFGYFAHVHRTGDVAGNLPESRALCRWCYEWVRSRSTEPPENELTRHHKGLTVRVRA